MEGQVELLRERGTPVPEINTAPRIVIQNETDKAVIQAARSDRIFIAQDSSASRKRRNSDSSIV